VFPASETEEEAMRVLVVDDDRKLASMVRRELTDDGYAVDVAHDGEEGLGFADAGVYDLILLDVAMPGMDGLTVCRRLRERKIGTPVLMLTARDGVVDRVSGLDSGADDYLVKPFSFRELGARIRALLRRGVPGRDTVLRVADVEVDTVAHEVRRGGRPVELTSKEYAILEHFLRNPNRVLSRDQIAEHAWNYDFEAESNIIDVYIGNLRRKLDDHGEAPLLRTVRGVGYKLTPPR
jgi:DNA-binding response OmpR family regulator